MARAFKPQEREVIRKALLTKGRRLFAGKGLRGTTVQDLTRAAGIAQGAFYGFFPSKEELFLEILEAEEAAFFDEAAKEVLSENLDRQRLKTILLSAFERYRAHPFLGSLFARGDYQQLMRAVPEARMRHHVDGEVARVRDLMAALRDAGGVRTIEPKLLVAVLQAIFLLFLQQEEFGPEMFAPMIGLLVGLLADYLATTGARNCPE